MKIFAAVVFLFISLNVLSQDYKADVLKIVKDFQSLEEYSLVANVKVDGEEDYSFSASIKNSKKYGVRMKVDAIEMIVNSDYSISIDHEDETVQVQKDDFKDKSKRRATDDGTDQLARTLESSKDVKFLGVSGDLKMYQIIGQTDYEKTIVSISKKTGFFHSFEIFYDSDDISINSYKVTYSSFNKNPRFSKSMFDEKTVFLKKSSGDIDLIGKFKSYEIIRS